MIANINSSEAFATVIHSIQSGRTEILRNLGIIVDNNKAYADMAKSLGIATDALREQQKTQARANAVMEGATVAQQVYTASMETAGKKMLSSIRYRENMRVAVGTDFLPEYTKLVFGYADAL